MALTMTQRWNPWKHIADVHPQFQVHWHHELPDNVWGVTSYRRQIIWLCPRLDPAKRRCTLTHEIIHIERGKPPQDPAGKAREERIVSELAARRHITLPHLIDAYRSCRCGNHRELADQLWVDLPTLKTRMATLTPMEIAALEHDLDGDWQWLP